MLALKWPLGSDPELDIPPVPHPDIDLDLEIPPQPAATAPARAGAGPVVVEPNRPAAPPIAPFVPSGDGIDDLDIPSPGSWATPDQTVRGDVFGIPTLADISPVVPRFDAATAHDDPADAARVIRPSPEEDLRSRRPIQAEPPSQSEPPARPRPAWKDPDYVPDWGMTEERKGPEYVIPVSEDRPEREYDIPVSQDRAEPEVVFTPIEPAPTRDQRIGSPAQANEGSPDGLMRRSAGERPAAATPIEPVRPDYFETMPGSAAGQPAGTQPGPAAKQPAWKDPDYVPDWGTTEERKGPEFVISVSEERSERELDVPISYDRIEKEYVVPLSRDREERDDDIAVPISHDKPERDIRFTPSSGGRDRSDEIAVPISHDRIEKDYYGPLSRDREERDIPVPISQDRVEKDYYTPLPPDRGPGPAAPGARLRPDEDSPADLPDFGAAPAEPLLDLGPETVDDHSYFGEVSDTLAAMELGSEIAASLAQLVKEASADEAHVAEEIRIRFTAWYDTHSEAVTTFITDPCVREPDGSESAYHSVLSAGPSPERCLALDCEMLEQLKTELAPLRAEGARFLLGLPVAASTLLRPKFRSQYLQLWTDIDDETRQMIRLTAYNLPETAASQASDLFGWMRSLGRQPIVRIPPRVELIAPLGGFGIYVVAVNYQKWFTQLGPQLFVETLLRLIKQCRQHRVRLALTKLPDRRAVQIGIAAGVDYLEIGTVERTADLPRLPLKIARAQSIQRFGSSFVNGKL